MTELEKAKWFYTDLAALIAAGRGDSDEAEGLRDRVDWIIAVKLSAEEEAEFQKWVEDLKSKPGLEDKK